MNQTEEDCLRLHLTRGLGRARLFTLLNTFGSARAALEADPREWERRAKVSRKLADQVPPIADPRFIATSQTLSDCGVRLISLLDQNYPPLLRTIPDPPALLYVRGTLPTGPALAVVGARKATDMGRRLTREFCNDLADAGLTIVSGLARGIDTAAHLGALDGLGKTVAVLGCGIDRIYPPENQELFFRISKSGAIISEYPPGTEPLAGHFPGRNRLISGLSGGVLVVEAAEASGSLITVDFALDQGREVFSVPGGPLSPTSVGTNKLLKDGAHLVTEARDIIEVLLPGHSCDSSIPREEIVPDNLSDEQKKLFKSLTFEPLHIDVLSRKSDLTPMVVSDILLHLELAGWVEQLSGARFVRSRS